jgi:hypothetical protein
MVKQRMLDLQDRIYSIGNLSYLDVCTDYESVLQIAIEVNRILNGNYFCPQNGVFSEKISKQGLEAVEEFINKIIKTLHEDPFYQELLQAYLRDDQKEIGKLATSVFNELRLEKRITTLYHGIRLIQDDCEVPGCSEITPLEYIEIAKSICDNGLMPSKFAMHHSIDLNVRPIWFVTHVNYTHGFVFVGVNPEDYSVFNPHFESERLVYTKSLLCFDLFIKSEEYVKQRLGEIEALPIWTADKLLEFREKAELELEKSGLRYCVWD